jgi:hypothetical protein
MESSLNSQIVWPAWFKQETGFRFVDIDGDECVYLGHAGHRSYVSGVTAKINIEGNLIGTLPMDRIKSEEPGHVYAYKYKNEWHMTSIDKSCAENPNFLERCHPHKESGATIAKAESVTSLWDTPEVRACILKLATALFVQDRNIEAYEIRIALGAGVSRPRVGLLEIVENCLELQKILQKTSDPHDDHRRVCAFRNEVCKEVEKMQEEKVSTSLLTDSIRQIERPV